MDRGLAKMARVSGRDVDFGVVAPSTHRRGVPVAWLESNETSCILYTSGTTRKPKGVQRDVGGYAGASTSIDTIFGGKAGGVFFCASDIGWVAGIRISFTRRCWRGWRLSFTKDYRPGRMRRVVENRREISG
ncbi:AMP-binding protein [Escherichia coli]